jgi:TPR repeat protein
MVEGNTAQHNKDYEQAARWFKVAGDLGHGPGLTSLGFLYEMGHGVERNPNRAFELYSKGAEAGDAQGMFHTGACYSKGIGTTADQSKAIEWWHKSVETEKHPSAAYNLGIRYQAGTNGAVKDNRRAIELFEMAAHQGHLGAMYNYGVFVAFTPGPRKNYTEGCRWFLNVTMSSDDPVYKSDPSISRAMNNLALCYLKGRGMPHDVAEGKRWLELAADQGGIGGSRAQELLKNMDQFKTYKKPRWDDL